MANDNSTEHAAEPADAHSAEEKHAGFVSFVGRPNVGKSTLMNALVGERIAITSSKPQTTRKTIRGVRNEPGGQLVIVDTPGIHRPRTLLGQRLNELVEASLTEVDVIGLCVPANEPIGPGDRFINAQLDNYPNARFVAIVTKLDLASRDAIAAQLMKVNELREWDLVIPVGALTAENVTELAHELIKLLPVSPPLFDADDITGESDADRVAELIRESALEDVTDELPHSIAVVVTEMAPRDDQQLVNIYADIVLERDSQKGIIIGRKGSQLKHIGQRARAKIEHLLGTRVYLDLHVRVAKEWQRSPKELGRLGF